MVFPDSPHALDAEIAKAEKECLRAVEAGKDGDAIVAAARCAGLRQARDLLLGVDPACRHLTHHWVRKDERGLNVWACDNCGELYSAGASPVPT